MPVHRLAVGVGQGLHLPALRPLGDARRHQQAGQHLRSVRVADLCNLSGPETSEGSEGEGDCNAQCCRILQPSVQALCQHACCTPRIGGCASICSRPARRSCPIFRKQGGHVRSFGSIRSMFCAAIAAGLVNTLQGDARSPHFFSSSGSASNRGREMMYSMPIRRAFGCRTKHQTFRWDLLAAKSTSLRRVLSRFDYVAKRCHVVIMYACIATRPGGAAPGTWSLS